MSISVVSKRGGAFHEGVYIGRPSPLGNPFVIGKDGSRADVIRQYEAWLRAQLESKNQSVCDELNRLYRAAKRGDLNLICWCAPLPCHGDVIKKLIEAKL